MLINTPSDMKEQNALKIGSLAVKAILYEVSCYPKPGLVTPISKGAHRDMDYHLFIESAMALNPYFPEFVKLGYSDMELENIFKETRKLGIEAEKDMMQSTGGVNTHKGMIFVMGLLCVACGYIMEQGLDMNSLQAILQKMTRGLTGELASNNERMTHGREVYEKFGITGIRGEMESGLPVIFDHGLLAYRKAAGLEKNQQLLQTLIVIMQYCEDSTIIYRHNLQMMKKIQNKSKEIVELGGVWTDKGKKGIRELELFCEENYISPGGSADLLAATVFIDYLCS